jgi:hypothetical protein
LAPGAVPIHGQPKPWNIESHLQLSQQESVDPPGEARVWRAKLNSSWTILEDALCEVRRKCKFGLN